MSKKDGVDTIHQTPWPYREWRQHKAHPASSSSICQPIKSHDTLTKLPSQNCTQTTPVPDHNSQFLGTKVINSNMCHTHTTFHIMKYVCRCLTPTHIPQTKLASHLQKIEAQKRNPQTVLGGLLATLLPALQNLCGNPCRETAQWPVPPDNNIISVCAKYMNADKILGYITKH